MTLRLLENVSFVSVDLILPIQFDDCEGRCVYNH